MFKKMFKFFATMMAIQAVQRLPNAAPIKRSLDDEEPKSQPRKNRHRREHTGTYRFWKGNVNTGRNKAKREKREAESHYTRRQLVQFHTHRVRKKNRGNGLNDYGYPIFG